MTNAELALTRDQRDEIMKAVKAIERQVKEIASASQWQALYVIGTNLTIIQTAVSDTQRVSSN
jgi:hypothetical protein